MSEGGGEAEERFRVRVSLERYFSDERARVYMSCARERPVRALARRLRRAFRLPRPFALLSRGHLLPPDEPLALLARDDPVQVVPTRWAPPADEPPDASDPLSDDTPAPPADTPPRSASPAPPALGDVKRRALDMLDRYCAPQLDSPERHEAPALHAPGLDHEDPPDRERAPAPRRRRVRRRPRRAPAGSASPVAPGVPAGLAVPAGPAVLRNRSASPRAARRVPAASPPPRPEVLPPTGEVLS